ncbi:GDSL esterase/lipase At5g03610-like [Cryptomeria japonica]|uniref:GDSL esterase/lipase At5g03610-like n=1 Tax=Cryptomeria japonica TaxID=3369 RepID=UPI0027DA2A0D|nr:GDSL esterase/lipase At5g03610-like [Cryptomeria japonica]
MFIPGTRRIIVRRDVKFIEDKAFRRSRDLPADDRSEQPMKAPSPSQGQQSSSTVTSTSIDSRRGIADKAQALFVFGDSYADTGNRNPYNQTVNESWRRPYGSTWPGYPAGRYSSGKVQTDSYELLRSHGCKATAKKIRRGVNFAVGGSGIFQANGFITVAQQVKQFKKVIGQSHEFDSQKLSQSVVLISLVGNDYLAFLDSRNGSIEGVTDLVKPVVSGIIDAVKELYESGLRNFAVSNIVHFGCGPQIGRTSCDSNYDEILALHTKLMREGVEILKSDLKELSIIISDLMSAVNHIFASPAQFGFVDLFVPCCAAKGRVDMCGEVDRVGRALYEVCFNVDEKFLWDLGHPTQREWHAIMWLYSHGANEENKTISFIEGAPNVIDWSSMIREKYDQTLQEIDRLLDNVNADILIEALDFIVGLHATFGNSEHDDGELVKIKHIQQVSPMEEDDVSYQ